MNALPEGFARFVTELVAESRSIEGHLTDREISFLALLASCPTTCGDVLEIGSFKGKSTIILAKGARLAAQERIVAVDPLTSPSVTDPSLRGEASGLPDFRANLERAGVAANVEFHQMFSGELAQSWDRKLRLLWIDGDHTVAGSNSDYEQFSPHLADGAIIAFHDVLRFEGPTRVFADRVLLDDHFHPFGICGTIGWAQYRAEPRLSRQQKKRQHAMSGRLNKLVDFIVAERKPNPLRKVIRNVRRWRVPHAEVKPGQWLQQATFLA